jgi:hypothetical protein
MLGDYIDPLTMCLLLMVPTLVSTLSAIATISNNSLTNYNKNANANKILKSFVATRNGGINPSTSTLGFVVDI